MHQVRIAGWLGCGNDMTKVMSHAIDDERGLRTATLIQAQPRNVMGSPRS